jgi:hypothetical protein
MSLLERVVLLSSKVEEGEWAGQPFPSLRAASRLVRAASRESTSPSPFGRGTG